MNLPKKDFSLADTLADTIPIPEARDAHVYIFVDEFIHRPLKSLLVWDGYDRKDELVTAGLATLNNIKSNNDLRTIRTQLEKTLGKEIFELLHDGNIKVHTLLDTPGGFVHHGMDIIMAMDYTPDSEAYITCQAYSMGATIAEKAVTRHGWEGGNMMWHLTSDILEDPNSPEMMWKADYQMKKIKDFLFHKSNKENRKAFHYIIESAVTDPNRPDNSIYLSNRFLHESGIIDINHFTLPEMHTSLCLSTGIYHEDVHKFFKVSEETAYQYTKYIRNYNRKSKSWLARFFPPTNKSFQTMRKEIRELFESKVRLR